MTTPEAIIELEDWVHERERPRPAHFDHTADYYNVPYDARTNALRLAVRCLKDRRDAR